VQKRLGSVDAAAIRDARALLQGRTGDSSDVVQFSSTTCESETSVTGYDTGRSANGTSGANACVPLAEANRVYMLLGDVARLRERGTAPSRAALVAVFSEAGAAPATQDGPLGRRRQSGGSDLAAATVSATAPPTPTPTVAAATTTADAKLNEIDAVLRRWEGVSPSAAGQDGSAHSPTSTAGALAAAAVVRSLLAAIVGVRGFMPVS
jgi:hypothetical protein